MNNPIQYKMDLADKGLLMHLLGNHKWVIQDKINSFPMHSINPETTKEILRLKMELEMIECANDIIQDIP